MRRVLRSKYYTKGYGCHDEREGERGSRRWRGLSNDREAGMIKRRREGLSIYTVRRKRE